MMDEYGRFEECEECQGLVPIKIVGGTSLDGEPKWEKRCFFCNSIIDED